MTTLEPGMQGPEIGQLQQQLNKVLGCHLNGNGVYGPLTAKRVKQFQHQHGLPETGIYDEQTRGQLMIAVAQKDGFELPSWQQPVATVRPTRAISAPSGKCELSGDTIPDCSPEKEGRYRLVTVNGNPHRGSRSNAVTSQMALIDPQGNVVCSMDIVTGGWGRGALPGMDPSTYRANFSQNPIIAEYPLDWNNMRARRHDKPSFRYANGEPGFSIGLENADNMGALGGAHRGAFRCHPGGQKLSDNGREPYSAGCVKILNDDDARNLWNTMMRLPPGQRPLSLEILNRDYVGPGLQTERFQTASASPGDLGNGFNAIPQPAFRGLPGGGRGLG